MNLACFGGREGGSEYERERGKGDRGRRRECKKDRARERKGGKESERERVRKKKYPQNKGKKKVKCVFHQYSLVSLPLPVFNKATRRGYVSGFYVQVSHPTTLTMLNYSQLALCWSGVNVHTHVLSWVMFHYIEIVCGV